MRDIYPDELPAMSYRPEDYEMMDIFWDKHIEEMYWHELMTTAPLDEGEAEVEEKGEREAYLF